MSIEKNIPFITAQLPAVGCKSAAVPRIMQHSDNGKTAYEPYGWPLDALAICVLKIAQYKNSTKLPVIGRHKGNWQMCEITGPAEQVKCHYQPVLQVGGKPALLDGLQSCS